MESSGADGVFTPVEAAVESVWASRKLPGAMCGALEVFGGWCGLSCCVSDTIVIV